MGVLEIQDLKYSYDNKKNVLNGINAQMELGKIYVILGTSGCGKTTLLSLLGGLDSASKGKILFNGKDIAEKGLENHRRNHVSFIFQAYNLIDYMTPLENVKLTSKLPPEPILEKMGLTKEEMKRNVLQLSGGQQQRVDTAMSIMRILEESVHHLNKCAIIVTHSNEVAKRADVVFQLKRGTLQIIDTLERI